MVKYRFFILTAFLIVLSAAAYSADTVIIRDTVYVFDSTKAVATTVAELKAEFYDLTIEGLEREKSSANTLFTLVAIILGLLSIATTYAAYSAKKSRDEVEEEIARIRGQRDTIDKEVAITRELRISVEREAGELRNKTDEIRIRLDKESGEIHSELKIFKSEIDETRAMLDKVIEEKTGQFDELIQSAKQSSKEIDKITEDAKKDQIVSPEKIAELIESPDANKFIAEYERIVSKYREIDALQSIPSKLHKTAGISYLHQKKIKEALFAFQRYLSIIPGDTDVNFQCAYCLGELSQHDEAIRYSSMVIISDPENRLGFKAYSFHNWGTDLGELYAVRKDEKLLEESIEKFNQAIAINDKSAMSYNNLGNMLGRLYIIRKDESLLSDAIAKFKKALKIFPEYPSPHYGMACIFALKEQKGKMLSSLGKAISLDSKYKKMALQDEDFAAYKDDPEFLALVKPSKDDKDTKDKSE